MFTRHPALADREDERRPSAPSRTVDPSVPARACCCPARPMVKVIMPPASGRPDPVDLWLCGHHYHVSAAALAAAGATVDDLSQPAAPELNHTHGPVAVVEM